MNPETAQATRTAVNRKTVLEAVVQPRRREILRLVWDEERCAGEIAAHFDVTFGAVSQHLRVLREVGAVTLRREGRQRFYRARRQELGPLGDVLEATWRGHLGQLRTLAEAEERAVRDERRER